jgi:peptide methionine sulfoxide reductase MsrA
MPDPTYHDMGDHTEVVQVDFDPRTISYGDLLEIFWADHDPLRPGFGTQYRNVVLFEGEAQRRAALASKERTAARLGGEVRTEVLPLDGFRLAEDYHQKFHLRSRVALARELSERSGDPDWFVSSTEAARLNGYLGGHGGREWIEREMPHLEPALR